MAHATQTPPHAPHGHNASGAAPVVHDPEHDINGRTVTLWVVSWGVIFFIALYFMLPLFDNVLREELDRKKTNLPNDEYAAAAATEKAFLAGTQTLDGKPKTGGRTIEQVMKEMVQK